MGRQHGGDSGNIPPEGNHGQRPDDSAELPKLPRDVTIPDDLSELADEAERIRRELADQRRAGGSAAQAANRARPDEAEPSIGVPLLIMSVAVLITLLSLFAMAWSGPSGIDQPGTGPDAAQPSTLPDVSLTDSVGRPVYLAHHLPMVILLVEECADCGGLIADTTASAPDGVTVAAVGTSVPQRPAELAPEDPTPLLLADRNGTLRDELGLGAPTNAATVVLVDGNNEITQRIPGATTIAQFRAELAELGG